MAERGMKPRRGRAVLAAVLVLSTAGLAATAMSALQNAPIILPVRYVRIGGPLQRVTPNDVRHVLLPWVQERSFFAVDVNGIEEALTSLPWVEAAQVVRLWSDTLEIQIVEQRPVARWGDEGFLNARGEIFAPGSTAGFPHLPVIKGPAGQEKSLLNMLRLLNEKLAVQHTTVSLLELSKRRAWKIRLADQLEIEVGRQDPITAVERFLALRSGLGAERTAAIRKVDLRYPNGFSVIWRLDSDSNSERMQGALLSQTVSTEQVRRNPQSFQ